MEPVTVAEWYWPHWHSFNDDGSLTVKVTGWDSAETHWVDYRTFAADAPEYGFLTWLVREKRPGRIVGQEQLARYREEYQSGAEPGAV